MTMTRAALKTDLQGILGDAYEKFSQDANALDRHLDIAALDMGRKFNRTLVVKLTLVADQSDYAAPSDLSKLKFTTWGDSIRSNCKPWEYNIGQVPKISLLEISGARFIHFEPAPTAKQIAAVGSDCPVFYYAAHKIGATEAETTIPAGSRHYLLIRAAAQALLELANSGSMKPVRLGSQGVGDMPKNGTPASLAAQWLEIFEKG